MTKFFPEMSLFNEHGHRLYLTEQERHEFLQAAKEESRENRIFCAVLHYTGCRISEALELSPQQISISDQAIIFRTLKKRKFDNQGNIKKTQYRSVPVPERIIEDIDLVFDLRKKRTPKEMKLPFWTMSRTTAWRTVKRVMFRVGIIGPQATAKGLRHGFGVAMVTGDKPLPLHILADLMGHSSTATTEIYTKVIGGEKQKMVLQIWEK